MGEEIEKTINEVPNPPPAVPEIAPMKKYIAELIGTMVLVLMGCGSAVIAGKLHIRITFGIAFAFGLAVLAMVYAIGGISGCHINPAISISMLGCWKNKRKRHGILRCFSMHRRNNRCRHTLRDSIRKPSI